MNESIRKYNKEFKEIKLWVINRDNWRCQWLSKEHSERLDCHHIIPRSLSGKNEKENLITVCRKCHNDIELLPYKIRVKKCQQILRKKYNYKYKKNV